VAFSNSSSSTRSFGAWMFAKPSVVPTMRMAASGAASCSELTSGMDPPAPIVTVGAPHAADQAARAASKAGLEVRAAKPFPVAPACTCSRMPNGSCSSRWRISAACASPASCSGWTRRFSLARAYGETALTASSTDGTSIPMTVIPGPDHTREPRLPVPISGCPSTTSASARNSSSVLLAPGQSSRRSPSTATSPCSSCSVARARISASRASGAAPPYSPLCLADARVRTSTVTLAMPRSATVRVGTPGRTLPMSPMIMTSAPNISGFCGG
jgi:hypothetical protein